MAEKAYRSSDFVNGSSGTGGAAAFAAFQPSMGTLGEAQAAMQSAVNQLNGSVAQITYAVAQAYIGASIAHHSMWMAISSGEAAAQAAFSSQMHQFGIQMDQAAADFGERAAVAALVGVMAEDAAATNHSAALSSWAVASATKRPEDLASAEQSLLFERLHGAFFVAGVTIGWAPVVGDALDLTESALYFYEGNNFDGWMNVAFAIVPLVSSKVFRAGKTAAGLAESVDGINTVRHGVGQALQAGGKTFAHSADEIGASIGRTANRYCDNATSICFKFGDPLVHREAARANRFGGSSELAGNEIASASFPGWLVGSVLVGVGVIAAVADDRRRRRLERELAMSELFGDGAGDNVLKQADDDFEEALARSRYLTSTAANEERLAARVVSSGTSAATTLADEHPRAQSSTARVSEGGKRVGIYRNWRPLLWLLLSFVLAGAWLGTGQTLIERSDELAAIEQAIGAADAAAEHETINVEDVRVGMRIAAHNPDAAADEDLPTAVDPSAWKLLRLHAEERWTDGTLDTIEVEALVPPEWLLENRAAVSREVPIPLDLVEMGLPANLRAHVMAIEPCPPLEEGPGHVVLTTINHLNSDVYELTIEDVHGRRETVHPTGFHKMQSSTRSWISAKELQPGESLGGLSDLKVISIAPLPGVHRVANFTVEQQHVYHVGALGALAHNMDCVDAVASRLKRLGYDDANVARIMKAIENGQQVVVVGENMARVRAMARIVERAGGSAVIYNPRTWAGLTRNSLEANRSWIRYWAKRKGAPVIDIGRQRTPRVSGPSPFYNLEHRSLKKWGIYTPF